MLQLQILSFEVIYFFEIVLFCVCIPLCVNFWRNVIYSFIHLNCSFLVVNSVLKSTSIYYADTDSTHLDIYVSWVRVGIPESGHSSNWEWWVLASKGQQKNLLKTKTKQELKSWDQSAQGIEARQVYVPVIRLELPNFVSVNVSVEKSVGTGLVPTSTYDILYLQIKPWSWNAFSMEVWLYGRTL